MFFVLGISVIFLIIVSLIVPKPTKDMFNSDYITALYREAHSIAISATDGSLALRDESDATFDTVCQMLRERGPVTSFLTVMDLSKRLMDLEKEAGVSMHVYRQRILLTNMLLWERLDHETLSGYQAFSAGNATIHWLGPLFRRCSLLITSGILSEDLDAFNYVPGFVMGTSIYQYRQKDRAKYVVDDADTLLPLITMILRNWFNLPSNRYLMQARFIRELVDKVSSDALLLDTVWKTSRSLKAFILGPNSYKTLTEKHIFQWSDQVLSAHVICDPASSERKLLTSVGVFYRSVHSQNPQLEALIRFLHKPRISTTQIPDTAAEDSVLNESTLVGTGSIPDRRSPEITTPEPSPTPEPPQAPPSSFTLSMWLRQIELLYPLLDSPADAIVIPLKLDKPEKKRLQFLKHVQENSDRKLPFRDLAPSRRRILEDSGPFSAAHLRTKSGLFSALIFRGITGSAPFLFEQKQMYSDYADFKGTCDSLLASGKPESYFWYGNAYTAWTNRSYEAAETYWNSLGANKAEFVDWLVDGEVIGFKDLFEKFCDGIVRKGVKAFPHFGALTAYLLAVDYAVAGCAKIPSTHELGEIVYRIKAGGTAGLVKLGFDCGTEDSTARAFSQAHQYLSLNIPAMQKRQMNFSIFTTEHALCKLSRLNLKAYRPLFTLK